MSKSKSPVKRQPRMMSVVGKRLFMAAFREMKVVALESRGWNVEKWAEKAGVTNQTVYNLVNGRFKLGPYFDTVCKLAAAVQMELVTAEKGVVELRSNRMNDKQAPKIRFTQTSSRGKVRAS